MKPEGTKEAALRKLRLALAHLQLQQAQKTDVGLEIQTNAAMRAVKLLIEIVEQNEGVQL
ncbi:hypothetical protein [Candidatus Chlorohelix sp.]|uniref:hypothetical protein n=1 Tax=Candidatus Chlorohelix sp. TaxID=3139201 RepID=UPI00305AB922